MTNIDLEKFIGRLTLNNIVSILNKKDELIPLVMQIQGEQAAASGPAPTTEEEITAEHLVPALKAAGLGAKTGGSDDLGNGAKVANQQGIAEVADPGAETSESGDGLVAPAPTHPNTPPAYAIYYQGIDPEKLFIAPRPTEETSASGSNGFCCTNCGQYNGVHSSGTYFYVITAGTKVGVFMNWLIAKAHTVGISRSAYIKVNSWGAAIQAFDEAYEAGTVVTFP